MPSSYLYKGFIMNNVTSITKAPRLTEQEVHAAAQNLIDSDESVSSLSLLKVLGRGSLTTITKYMSTFNRSNEDTALPILPDFTELPETLSRSTKLLAIKIWAESQEIANKELESQREVLQQAAKLSAERVKEAEVFSDEQAKRLDELERSYGEEIEELRNKLNVISNEVNAKNDQLNELTIEYEVAKNENISLKAALQDSKEQLRELKISGESELSNSRHDAQNMAEELKIEIKNKNNTILSLEESFKSLKNRLETENKRLDLQVAKQQLSLDLISKRLEEEKYFHSVDIKENKALREKSALIEGELTAWKQINLAQDEKVKKNDV